MKQEDIQLLLKDLCSRLPYGVIIYSKEYEEANYRKHYLQRLFNISAGRRMEVTCVDVDDYPDPKCREHKLELCRPYLRPISSMTRDEVEELKSKCIHTETEEDWEGVRCDSWGIEILDKYDTRNRNNQIDAVSYINMDAIDWLNARHFDYRNLIKRGLALPAPEGMYKF